VVVKPLTRL